MAVRRPLVAGNWKMNGLHASSSEILALKSWRASQAAALQVELMVCPPATLLASFAALMTDSQIALGAQDCHWEVSGAFTGDLSAIMLADAGAKAVILGHSERRSGHGERDIDVRKKADAVHAANLMAIICIGETAGERRMGLTLPVIGRQLRNSLPASANAANTVIAYEPVWAIGTGLTPTADDIAQAHAYIREQLAAKLGETQAEAMRILYGGSVKPQNAAEIFRIKNVDGGLVGGASLKAADFSAIASAYLA